MKKSKMLFSTKINDFGSTELGVYGVFDTEKVEWRYFVVSYTKSSYGSYTMTNEICNSYVALDTSSAVRSGKEFKTKEEGEQYIGKLSWDGNFSIRNIAGAKYIHHWSSNTSKFGTPPYFMVLSHKGNLIISDSTGLLRNITDTYHHKIGNDINLDYPKRSYVTSTPLYIPSPELLNWANVEGISCTYLQGEFAYTELQLNGNFMIISTVPPYGILWQNGVNIRPQKITMSIRDDGILMEWDENGNFVWNSSGAGSSFGKPPYYMQLNANSHLIITDKDGNTMDITPNVNQPYYALYDNNTNKLYRNPKAGEGELSYCSNKPILPNLDTLEKGFKCTIS